MLCAHPHSQCGTRKFIWYDSLLSVNILSYWEKERNTLNTNKWNTISQFKCVCVCYHYFVNILTKYQTNKNQKDMAKKLSDGAKILCLSFNWCKRNDVIGLCQIIACFLLPSQTTHLNKNKIYVWAIFMAFWHRHRTSFKSMTPKGINKKYIEV